MQKGLKNVKQQPSKTLHILHSHCIGLRGLSKAMVNMQLLDHQA